MINAMMVGSIRIMSFIEFRIGTNGKEKKKEEYFGEKKLCKRFIGDGIQSFFFLRFFFISF